MDPETLLPIISETIKATYEISKTIDSLITSNTVPPEIAAFPSQLDSVRNAIIGIQSCLESSLLSRDGNAVADESLQQLLSAISASLHSFQRLLADAHALLKRVYAPAKGNLIQRAAREIQNKLNLKGGEDEVILYLTELLAFRQNFQLALQTITVYITVHIRGSAHPDVAGRLDALFQSISALDPDGTYAVPGLESAGSTVWGSDIISVRSSTSDLSESALHPAEKDSVIKWLDAISNDAPEKEDDSEPEKDDFGVRSAAQRVISSAQNDFRSKAREDEITGNDTDSDSRAKIRLLHTTTLKLHEFFGREIPYYAILSHRWGVDEVTFQDLQKDKENVKTAGWEKIIGCCAQARKEGWEYVWIDSCCIDKSSSAELSEAINSMFQWYSDAQVCYAYLNDVPAEESNHERAGSAFRNSSWFTRGWTLQELLAPQTVFFFNRQWVEIGTKCTFDKLISSVTGIDCQFLEGDFESASIAQKFSWASKRQTLRVEDMAYCLMGLFAVNMPLLYGEGSKAFIRLQLEIMKVSDDDSLFAWSDWSTRATPSQTTGLLANSPIAFQYSGAVVHASGSHKAMTPHLMTNRGLSISLALMPADEAWKRGVQSDRSQVVPHIPESSQFFAPLSCSILNEDNTSLQIMLRLAQFTDGKGHQRYARLCSTSLHLLPAHLLSPASPFEKPIYVPQTPYIATTKQSGRTLKVTIDDVPFSRWDGDNWVSSACSGRLVSGTAESIPVLKLGSSKNDSVALLEFRNDSNSRSPSGERDKFVLQIHRDVGDRGTVGIDLLAPGEIPLDELYELVLDMKRDESVPRRDRATLKLPSGWLVIAALRKRAQHGELTHVVDFENSLPPDLGSPYYLKRAENEQISI